MMWTCGPMGWDRVGSEHNRPVATSPTDPSASVGAGIDAVLLASFGGPEGPAEVMPFLRRVTAGRPVPEARLAAVAQQYLHFGGVSPINAQNRALQERLRAALSELGLNLPVYFGNRNWHPYFAEVLPKIAADGHSEIAIVATSGFASQPGCRQYQDDVAAAIKHAGLTMRWQKIGLWFDHPVFLQMATASVLDALAELSDRNQARSGQTAPVILFSTHSLPVSVAAVSGPADQRDTDGGAYVAQHRLAAAAITRDVSTALRQPVSSELVFQSRSGSPATPWLEPDINARLEELAGSGVDSVVVFPLGFATDHMEIKWDLDVRAKATAETLGMCYARARTVGTDPRFARMLAAMVAARMPAPGAAGRMAQGNAVADPDRPAGERAGSWPDQCPPGCCVANQPSRTGSEASVEGG